MDKFPRNCLKSKQMWIISFLLKTSKKNAEEINLPFKAVYIYIKLTKCIKYLIMVVCIDYYYYGGYIFGGVNNIPM